MCLGHGKIKSKHNLTRFLIGQAVMKAKCIHVPLLTFLIQAAQLNINLRFTKGSLIYKIYY
jgi:hypothetical protein